MANGKIKCVIFDSDGTLVDSEFLGHYCMELALGKLGVCISASKMKEDYRGWKLDSLLKDIQSKNVELVYPEDFIANYRVELDKMFKDSLQAIADVEDAVSQIKLPICVASSGPMFKIETAMSVTGLKKYFEDRLYSAYDLGVWKPEPDLFLHAAEDMGFLPEECVVIEDSIVGVQAGLAAGMKVIHFNPESISLEGIEATLEIDSMSNLLNALKSIELS